MNRVKIHPSTAAADQFGMASAALLEEGSRALPPRIQSRLQQARMKALAVRKPEKVGITKPVLANAAGNWVARSGSRSLWDTVGWVAPLVVLVFGLIGIAQWQDDSRISDMAAVDAALLTDDVPPDAYADSGFMAYLKNNPASDADSATTETTKTR